MIILIKGMEMPTFEQGVRTINVYADGVVSNYAEEQIGIAVSVPTWHRVEDGLPPKATWVLTVATDGNVKIFNIATVDAGGQWWTYSPQKILRELYGVRYWMPIEPPKEEKQC